MLLMIVHLPFASATVLCNELVRGARGGHRSYWTLVQVLVLSGCVSYLDYGA
jgi:hypothetical protein